MYKKPRLVLFGILVLTILAGYVNLPKITLFGYEIKHPPQINLKFGDNPSIIKRDLEPKLGLDLAGGVQLTMSADMQNIPEEDRDNALESAQIVVENRVNSLGVAEAVVQTAKTADQYRLIIEIPGISNTEEALSTVRQTAHLEFKTLKSGAGLDASSAATLENYESTGLTGRDLKRAQAQPSQDPQNPGYVVNLEFNGEGSKKLAEITQNHLNEPMGMFLDEYPISWPPPTIQAVITDGNAQISGNFDADSAKNLAIQLNAGALPVPLIIESQTRIGPTIGQEAIDKSIIATAIGLISVAVFMVAYYRVLGLYAVTALFIYTLLVFSIFKLIPVTLTLAGIAGFVLSIGMAVDANILIFERIKEELKWGKPRHEALFAGFDRAWSSIRDSNVSSLITTAILFNFGTGSIKGFALTLAIGILVSMFSAITVTRNLLKMFWVGKI